MAVTLWLSISADTWPGRQNMRDRIGNLGSPAGDCRARQSQLSYSTCRKRSFNPVARRCLRLIGQVGACEDEQKLIPFRPVWPVLQLRRVCFLGSRFKAYRFRAWGLKGLGLRALGLGLWALGRRGLGLGLRA